MKRYKFCLTISLFVIVSCFEGNVESPSSSKTYMEASDIDKNIGADCAVSGNNSCVEKKTDPTIPFKTYARLLYVDKELETPYSISGNDFEKAFIDQYKEIFITDSIKADGLKKLVTHSTPANHSCELDTRIKLYLYKTRTDSSVIIVDGFDDICLDGTPIRENKPLIKFINNLIPH